MSFMLMSLQRVLSMVVSARLSAIAAVLCVCVCVGVCVCV